jgi:hypothetical protein
VQLAQHEVEPRRRVAVLATLRRSASTNLVRQTLVRNDAVRAYMLEKSNLSHALAGDGRTQPAKRTNFYAKSRYEPHATIAAIFVTELTSLRSFGSLVSGHVSVRKTV